jgi:flavin reductase (DIM6/NTAB) family NADH-FMN oxidoreductase RutF/DNA-binding GntR family transcriptional regulator
MGGSAETSSSGTARQLSSNEFRDVIGPFASGVTIITVAHDGKPYGTTASAVSSLSLEPPMVLICMNKASTTGQAIAAAGSFAINVLNEEQDALARRFATKDPDKFSGTPVTTGPHGQPLLGDALATIECQVVEDVTGGTHTVFLGEVRSATSQEGSPLAYFRGEFGRLELARDRPIYEMIRERLLARELPVGRQLELPELAQGLQVPAGALYYALGRLSSEGMLERTGAGDFLVPPVTVETLDGAVDATCAIELGAVDMTIGRVPPAEVAGWREEMEAFARHVERGHYIDIDTSLDANTRFHETLIRFTGSEALLVSHRRVALPGILARAFQPRISETETDVAYGQDHRDIVDAFEAGDAPATRQAILRHGDRIKKAFRAGLAATGPVL